MQQASPTREPAPPDRLQSKRRLVKCILPHSDRFQLGLTSTAPSVLASSLAVRRTLRGFPWETHTEIVLNKEKIFLSLLFSPSPSADGNY